MSRTVLYLVLILFFFTSCEVINPPEQIPSYVAVDAVSVQINNAQHGSATHNISDSWLYVNGKLIGIFEAPFSVPVLESGLCEIQIEPGILNSGGDASRVVYPMMYGYYIDTVLVEGEILTLSPVFEYRPATFGLVEDFEDIGIEFEISEQSDTIISLISGDEAFEGKSMYFALDDDRPNFECKTSQLYEIDKSGAVYLEMDFKTNDYFNFGLFSKEYNGSVVQEVRKHVFTFNPTDEWKKVYIDLNYFVNNAAGTEFRLFYTCVRPDDSENDKTEVYIDNVKLLYLSTQ